MKHVKVYENWFSKPEEEILSWEYKGVDKENLHKLSLLKFDFLRGVGTKKLFGPIYPRSESTSNTITIKKVKIKKTIQFKIESNEGPLWAPDELSRLFDTVGEAIEYVKEIEKRYK